MNNSDGTAANLMKQPHSFKFDMKERQRDMLHPFYQFENYAWWFDERAQTKHRFQEKKHKPNFEEVLMTSTASQPCRK